MDNDREAYRAEFQSLVAEWIEKMGRTPNDFQIFLMGREMVDNAHSPKLALLADGAEIWSGSGPEPGLWQALASKARAQYMTSGQQQAAHQFEVVLLGCTIPAGDATHPPAVPLIVTSART